MPGKGGAMMDFWPILASFAAGLYTGILLLALLVVARGDRDARSV